MCDDKSSLPTVERYDQSRVRYTDREPCCALDEIEEAKNRDILSVEIWWSRKYQTYIASAPRFPDVIGCGATFTEAARNLDIALDTWSHETETLS